MSATVGFHGFYSKYSWVPVFVSIQDRTGEKDAVIRLNVDDAFDATRVAVSTLEWGVRLVPGKTVTREISVPGWVIDRNGAVQCWVGNELQSTLTLSGNQLGKVAFVAVLSRIPQAAQFLTGSTQGAGGLPVLPIAMDPNSLPTAANLLSSLTAVVATPDSLVMMDAAHRDSLLRWVKLGGLLVVTGTNASIPDWESVFPLLPGPPHTVKGVVLGQFARQATAVPPSFTVAASGSRDGAELWAGTQNSPVIASLTVGRGTVVQTSFLPTQSSLLAWQNSATLWTEILGKGTLSRLTAMPPGLTASPTDTLASASGVLAPLRVPSLPLWGGILAFYVLLIGPVLFIILRRLRAEPWAWLILPAVSVITTAAMYGFGLAQRPSGLLTEGTGVLDLVGDNTAEVVSVRSFTSPSPRAVSLVTSEPTLMLPLSQRSSRTTTDTTVTHGQTTVVHFANTGRWVVHDVLTEGTIGEQGTVDMRVWATLGVLSGVVQNNTPYPLHDAALCWNDTLIELGDISPGGAVTVSRSTPTVAAKQTYLPAYGNYNHDLTRGIGRSISNYAAQMNLFDGNADSSKVMLVATTTEGSAGMPEVAGDIRVFSDKQMFLIRESGNVVEFASLEGTSQ